jgi:anti-sigma-K factor RskA
MSGGHGEMSTLAAGYVIGALDPDEQRAFAAHLATCGICSAEVVSLSRVLPALAYAVPQMTPRLDLRSQVLASTSGASPQAGPRPAQHRAPRLRMWLPLAASLVIVLGLGAYTVSLRQRIVDLEVRLEQASSRALLADRAVTEARRVALQTQSATAILLSPDLARIELNGEGDAPGAMARALWSRQRGMVFTATNLPPLAAGKTYQVWVVTANAPLSAGLVEPDPEGRVMSVFNTPPDIPAPVAVAVTVEPAGGVPAPTGPRYLLGTPRT